MINILENIYNLIVEPKETIYKINKNPSVSNGVLLVVFISFFIFTLKYSFKVSNHIFLSYFISAFFFVLKSLFAWLMTALFFEMSAKIFNKSGHLENFLTLSAYAMTPFLFLAPLNILKNTTATGYFFSVIFSILLYFWSIYLFVKSLQISYDLIFSRLIMLIFLPFVGIFLVLIWTIGFFSKLFYIF